MVAPRTAALLLAATGASASSASLSRLTADSKLPKGFRVGTAGLQFSPVEKPDARAKMNLTCIVADEPTESFAAVFTRNKVPGAPVLVGKKRLAEGAVQAVLVNNKVSNVCARSPNGGAADSEALCEALAAALGLEGGGALVIPCSTGVIGWSLPVDAMVNAMPAAVAALQADTALPAATAIMTTDQYPKARAAEVLGGRVVALGKGAGMIEPNMATMLAFVLTDLAVPRDALRAALSAAAESTFNCVSVDGDQSTSDTVLAMASGRVDPGPWGPESQRAFEDALSRVCFDLAADMVRNGEGVTHVIDVTVRGAPSAAVARALGKAVVNSNLLKCAVAGNDPNVGRILAALGSCAGNLPELSAPDALAGMRVSVGGRTVFADGRFELSAEAEDALYALLREAEMPGVADRERSPWPFPPHERSVVIEVDLALGGAEARVLGGDLTHEYVSINADYRS